MTDKRIKEIKKINGEKARRKLRQIINDNYLADFRISITYTGRKPGSEAEIERYSK